MTNSQMVEKLRLANEERQLVLVELPWARDKDPDLPLGHASLLAALLERTKAAATSAVVPINQEAVDVEAVANTILAGRGETSAVTDVAVGVYVWSEEVVRELLTVLRREGFRGHIILGGPQISYAGPRLERHYPEADLFIRGYAEDALCEIVSRPDSELIRGVHRAGHDDRGEQACLDLDRLPSPWLTGLIPMTGGMFLRWETQRGCPYCCAFCQHREPGARLRRRELPMERIVAEIELFCRAGVTDIAVLDPIFNIGARATEILERFRRFGFSGRLSLQGRAERLTDDFLDAAQALDVRLELGLQTIHDVEASAIQRKNRLPTVENALAKLRQRGIDTEVTLIYGLPEQTLGSFEQTVDWCLRQGVPVIKAFPLMLLRGTELDRQRARWNLVEEGETMPAVVSSDSFDREEWLEMARLSEALRQTEGRHPRHIAGLRAVARRVEPEPRCWRLPPTRRAA